MVGMVDGCSYDSQLKYTVCDTCRPCHSILSVLKPVFRFFLHLIVLYIASYLAFITLHHHLVHININIATRYIVGIYTLGVVGVLGVLGALDIDILGAQVS